MQEFFKTRTLNYNLRNFHEVSEKHKVGGSLLGGVGMMRLSGSWTKLIGRERRWLRK